MLLTLELVSGPRAGEARAIDGNMAFSVGTEHGATWVLPGANGIARIDLRRGPDGFLAEASGLVTIDGQPVSEGATVGLGHGSRIGLGDAVLRATLAEGGTYGSAGRVATASRPTITSILADVTPGGEMASGMLPGRDGETWLESITGPGPGRSSSPARAFGYASEMAVRPLPESEKPLATYLPEDWNAPGDRQSRLYQAQVPSTAIGLRGQRESETHVARTSAPRASSDILQKALGLVPGEIGTEPERQLANAGAALKAALAGIARLERTLRQVRADLGLPLKSATTLAELDPFVVLSDEDGLSARALAARIAALERDQAALVAGIRTHLARARATLDPDGIAARVKDRRGVLGHLAPGTAEWQAYRALWSPPQAADAPLSEASLTRDIEAAGSGGEYEEVWSMKTENRVAWTEGMFLRVQHFQQADRWTDRLVRDRTEPLTPYPWGLSEVVVDRASLGIGRFALTAVRGILPDGTPFSAPEQCDLPAPVQLAEGATNRTVYLALPARRPGAPDFSPDGGSVAARMVRSDFDADDANSDTAFSAPISVGRLVLSLKLDSDERAGFETLPLARIVETRADLSVVLDEDMIPPALAMTANARLKGFLTELLGLVRHRAAAIARRAGDPSLRGSAEIGDYLMLQALNRASPVLAHLDAQAARIHPETAYRTLVSLAGELSTFTAANHLPTDLPDYNHLDPAATFDPVMDDLRRSLSAVLDQSAVLIPLEERRHGVRVGMLADAGLKTGGGLVLAARAEIPQEQLRRMLPNQIKIGPVERISELVNVALPGVQVRPMPVAPRQLPFRSGTVYFELETEGEIWRAIVASGTVAIHLAVEFPGLDMELWGIRT